MYIVLSGGWHWKRLVSSFDHPHKEIGLLTRKFHPTINFRRRAISFMEGIGVSNPHLQAMEFGHLEVVPQPLGTYDYSHDSICRPPLSESERVWATRERHGWWFLREVAKPNECVILSRSSDRGMPEVRGRLMLTQDARYHFDPDSMQYRDHVGRHPGIIFGLLKHKNLLTNMKWMVAEITKYPNLVVNIFCKSGRHRSVGEATLLAIVLEKLKIPFVVVHSEAHERRRGWRTMRCGSGCNSCGWHNDAGYEAALKDSNPIWTKVLQMVERERAPATVPSRRREIVDLETSEPSVKEISAVAVAVPVPVPVPVALALALAVAVVVVVVVVVVFDIQYLTSYLALFQLLYYTYLHSWKNVPVNFHELYLPKLARVASEKNESKYSPGSLTTRPWTKWWLKVGNCQNLWGSGTSWPEQWKNWLFRVQKGLYYPIKWGLS